MQISAYVANVFPMICGSLSMWQVTPSSFELHAKCAKCGSC